MLLRSLSVSSSGFEEEKLEKPLINNTTAVGCLLPLILLVLFLLVFRAAVPVVKDLQSDDAVACRGYDIRQSHQRIPGFLGEDNI